MTPSVLVVLAVLFGASVPCSGGPGGFADRRRSPLSAAASFAVDLDAYEEDDDEEEGREGAAASFLQFVTNQLPSSVAGIVGGIGGAAPVSIWPAEAPDPSYAVNLRRRRTEVSTSTFVPTEAANASAPCIVNGSGTTEIVTVKVPVEVPVAGGNNTVVKKVIETKYVPMPGETKYIPVPGAPYAVPGTPGSSGSAGGGCPCALSNPGVNAGVTPADWPVGCPPPTAPCVSSSTDVARVAAAAADLAHQNLQRALSSPSMVTPSPLAKMAYDIAQQAAARAAEAEDTARFAEAAVLGTKQRVKRLKNVLYNAASARAAELKKVRVVPPVFPVSIIPPGPPQSAYAAAPAPAAAAYNAWR